jgi:hypothetical protein
MMMKLGAVMMVLAMGLGMARAQEPAAPHEEHAKAEAHEGAVEGEKAEEKELPEPRTDFTLLVGSDFVRPGSLPRANLSLGMGHTFDVLEKDPLGRGVTFGYAYENTGTHGFFHTNFGEHSELLGQMRDFRVWKKHHITGYNWLQGGISSLTGDTKVHNRFSWNETLGVKFHLNRFNAIWVEETYNKVVTVPWYTVTSVGYTYSIR